MHHHLQRQLLYLSVVVFAFLLSPIIAHGTLYKWVDEKGVFHMSDTPPDPAIAEKYAIEKTGSDESEPAQVAEAKQEAKSVRHEVVIYTTPT
jgi:hypothetical protein